MRNNYIISAALIMLVLSGELVSAGSQKLIPQDTVTVAGGPWNIEPSLCGGGLNCRLDYVTDGVDGNYIWSLSGLSQLYSFTNTAGIPVDATIDSFVVWISCAVNNPASNDRIRPRIRSSGTTNYTDTGKGGSIANINIEQSTFADSSKCFTGFPDGAASGDSPLTIERMDSLEIQILDIIGDTNKVTECSVVVWYTEIGVELKGRRRHLIGEEGGFEVFAKYCRLDPNWVVGFKRPDWIWKE